MESILAKSRQVHHRNKVRLLLDFIYPDQDRIVPDPYFDGKFEESYRLIYEGCLGFFRQMTRQDK
jgi:protein-tyrosine-phosphatase